MKSLDYYLLKANKEGWAIGQFNFSDFTQLRAIIETGKKLRSPLILGTSEGESKFFGLKEAVCLRDFFRKKTKIPIFLNLDHGKSYDYILEAIKAGYDMVHFDGSDLSLEENIQITKKIVKIAKKKGVLVEGEVGKIGKESSLVYKEKFKIKETNLTDPQDALIFFQKTNVHLLALSIGNFHGISLKGPCPALKLNLLKEIKKRLKKNAFLVLHGGSGISKKDIKGSIKNGIVKININTEIRLAFCQSLRKILNHQPQEIRPYHFLPQVQKSIEKVVSSKIMLFGSFSKC